MRASGQTRMLACSSDGPDHDPKAPMARPKRTKIECALFGMDRYEPEWIDVVEMPVFLLAERKKILRGQANMSLVFKVGIKER